MLVSTREFQIEHLYYRRSSQPGKFLLTLVRIYTQIRLANPHKFPISCYKCDGHLNIRSQVDTWRNSTWSSL